MNTDDRFRKLLEQFAVAIAVAIIGGTIVAILAAKFIHQGQYLLAIFVAVLVVASIVGLILLLIRRRSLRRDPIALLAGLVILVWAVVLWRAWTEQHPIFDGLRSLIIPQPTRALVPPARGVVIRMPSVVPWSSPLTSPRQSDFSPSSTPTVRASPTTIIFKNIELRPTLSPSPTPVPVTPSPEPTPVLTISPTPVSRHGEQIVYCARIGSSSDYDIVLRDLQSEKWERLAGAVGTDPAPTWSPNGDRLVFVSNVNGYDQLYLLDLTTRDAEPLTHSDRDKAQPSWSPDGRYVAYAAAIDGDINDASTDMDLFVWDFQQSEERPLTSYPGTARIWGPKWSPNGKYIAFWSNLEFYPYEHYEIYLLAFPPKAFPFPETDPKDLYRWSDDPDSGPDDDEQFVWSPDGQRFAFINKADSAGKQYFDILFGQFDLMREQDKWPDDGTIHRIPDNAQVFEGAPAWSPDSTRIAFHRVTSGDNYTDNKDIIIFHAETYTSTNLTQTPKVDERWPAWRPPDSSFAPIQLPGEYLRDTLTLEGRFHNWPQGRVLFAGIPFNFDDHASFIQTEFEWPGDPDSLQLLPTASIPVNVDKPKRVYILMNLSYGCARWAPLGSKVGDIEFVFDGGESVIEQLKTGYNIREWVVEADDCEVVEEISASNIKKQVWSAKRRRSEKLSVIDMFVFDVPPDHVGQRLTSITIHDTSTSTTGFNPAILIFGLTVQSE